MFPVACFSIACFAAGPMSSSACSALCPNATPAPISLKVWAASYTCTSRCDCLRRPRARHRPPIPPPMIATLTVSVELTQSVVCGRDAIV